MLNNLIIRQSSREDIPGVLELFSPEGIDDGRVLSAEEALKIYNKFSRYPNYGLYVATIDNAIVGAFELLIMDNLAHKGAPSAIIEDVVVEVRLRSQGIGTKMMEYAMGICKNHGCYKLALSSNIKRNRAHGFYERLGFTRHGYSFLIEF